MAVLAEGQKKSCGLSRSQSKRESAAAPQAGEDACTGTAAGVLVSTEERRPLETRREVILPRLCNSLLEYIPVRSFRF